MSEHRTETGFQTHSIVFDDGDPRRKLEERIAQVQRDEGCVQRAASLMALFVVLGAVGFGYGAVLEENFPYGQSSFVIKLICEIGLAALISLVAFVGLLLSYRNKLNRLREECRGLVTKILESHNAISNLPGLRPLGQHRLTPLGGSPGSGQGPLEVKGSRDSLPDGAVPAVNKTP